MKLNSFNETSYLTSGYETGSDVKTTIPGTMTSSLKTTSSLVESTPEIFSPYPESVRSDGYQNDVLLIYDPDDYYYTEELLGYLAPRQLQIYDFARDAPPGLPLRQSFQTALRLCRYTCLVVTRNFISNFWLQFKADMAIQDMFDCIEKMYSVVVVVMEMGIQPKNLPLDFVTLSPIFRGERFFENRVKIAFQPKPIIRTRPWTNEECQLADREKRKHMENSEKSSGFSELSHNLSINSSTKDPGRSPTENSDNMFTLPPSVVMTTNKDMTSYALSEKRNSFTVTSTGCRQPREIDDVTGFSPVPSFRTTDYGSNDKSKYGFSDLANINFSIRSNSKDCHKENTFSDTGEWKSFEASNSEDSLLDSESLQISTSSTISIGQNSEICDLSPTIGSNPDILSQHKSIESEIKAVLNQENTNKCQNKLVNDKNDESINSGRLSQNIPSDDRQLEVDLNKDSYPKKLTSNTLDKSCLNKDLLIPEELQKSSSMPAMSSNKTMESKLTKTNSFRSLTSRVLKIKNIFKKSKEHVS